MAKNSQLKLVLWKNFLLRIRQPTIFTLEVFWPVGIFLLLLILRQAIPPKHQESCYYNSRALPSAGAANMLQSLLCNIDNECLNRSRYQEFPEYPGSKFHELLDNIGPLFLDQRVIDVIKVVPDSNHVLDMLHALLSFESVQNLLVKGIPVAKIVSNRTAFDVFLLDRFNVSKSTSEILVSSGSLSFPGIVATLLNDERICDAATVGSILVAETQNGEAAIADLADHLCSSNITQSVVIDFIGQINIPAIIKQFSIVIRDLGQPSMATALEDIGLALSEVQHFVKKHPPSGSPKLLRKILQEMSSILKAVEDVDFVLVNRLWEDFGKPAVPSSIADDMDKIVKLVITILQDASPPESSTYPSLAKSIERVLTSNFSDNRVSDKSNVFRNMIGLNGPLTIGEFVDSLVPHNGLSNPASVFIGYTKRLFAIVLELLKLEVAFVPNMEYFPVLPQAIRLSMYALSNTTRLQKLFEYGINNASCEMFDDILYLYSRHDDSEEIDAIRSYTCNLTQKVVLPLVRTFTNSPNALLSSDPAAMNVTEIVPVVLDTLHAFAQKKFYNFSKLFNTSTTFVQKVWVETNRDKQTMLVGQTIQLFSEFIGTQSSGWNAIHGFAALADYIVQLLTKIANDVLKHNNFTLHHLSLGISSIETILQKVINTTPELTKLALRVLQEDGVKPDFADFLRNGKTSKYVPCEKGYFGDLLQTTDTNVVMELETVICEQVKNFPTVVKYDPTLSAINNTINALRSETEVRFNWTKGVLNYLTMKSALNGIVDNFDGDILPDVELTSHPEFSRLITNIRVAFGIPDNEISKTKILLAPVQIIFEALNVLTGNALESDVFPRLTESIKSATKSLKSLRQANLTLPELFQDDKNVERLVAWTEDHVFRIANYSLDTLFKSPGKLTKALTSGSVIRQLCESPVGDIFELSETNNQTEVSILVKDYCRIIQNLATKSVQGPVSSAEFFDVLARFLAEYKLRDENEVEVNSTVLDPEQWKAWWNQTVHRHALDNGKLFQERVANGIESVVKSMSSFSGTFLPIEAQTLCRLEKVLPRLYIPRAINLNEPESFLKNLLLLADNSVDAVSVMFSTILEPQKVEKITTDILNKQRNAICNGNIDTLLSYLEVSNDENMAKLYPVAYYFLCNASVTTITENLLAPCTTDIATNTTIAKTTLKLLNAIDATYQESVDIIEALPTQHRFLNARTWTDLENGFVNQLQNGFVRDDLSDFVSWLKIILKPINRNPEARKNVNAGLQILREIVRRYEQFNRDDLKIDTVLSSGVAMSFLARWLKALPEGAEVTMWSALTHQKGYYPLSHVSSEQQKYCHTNDTEFLNAFCAYALPEVVSEFANEFNLSLSYTDSVIDLKSAETLIRDFYESVSKLSDHSGHLILNEKRLHNNTKNFVQLYSSRSQFSISRLIASFSWFMHIPMQNNSIWNDVVQPGILFAERISRFLELAPPSNVLSSLFGSHMPDDFLTATVKDIAVLVENSTKNDLAQIIAETMLDSSNQSLNREVKKVWKKVPKFLKYANVELCHSSDINDVREKSKVNAQLKHLIASLPNPQEILCDIDITSLAAAYDWIVNKTKTSSNTGVDANICTEFPETLAQLFIYVQSMMSTASKATLCFDRIRQSDIPQLLQKNSAFVKLLLDVININSKQSVTVETNGKEILRLLKNQLPVNGTTQEYLDFNTLPNECANRLKNTEINLNFYQRFIEMDISFCSKMNDESLLQSPDGGFVSNIGCNAEWEKAIRHNTDIDKLFHDKEVKQNASYSSGAWIGELLGNKRKLLQNLASFSGTLAKFVEIVEDGLDSKSVTALLVFFNEKAVGDLEKGTNQLHQIYHQLFAGASLDEVLEQLEVGTKALQKLQKMNIFDLTFTVGDLVDDKEAATKKMINEFKLNDYLVEFVFNLNFDISPYLLDSKLRNLSFKEVVDKPQYLRLAFEKTGGSFVLGFINKVENASEKLGIPDVGITVVAQQRMFKNFGVLLLDQAFKNFSLSWDSLAGVIGKLKTIPDIYPMLKNNFGNISELFDHETTKNIAKLNVSVDGVRTLASPEALKVLGKILCGRPLQELESQFKLLDVSNKEPTLSKHDLEILPGEFCRNGYEQVMRLTGGPIIWGFLKPVLRGRILYAPQSEGTQRIMKELNETLEVVGTFIDKLYAWGEGSAGFKKLIHNEPALLVLQNTITSKGMRHLIKQIANSPDFDTAIEQLNVTNISKQMGDTSGLLDMVQLIGNISKCFDLDRFQPVENEHVLERTAIKMSKKREFIAAIVFPELDGHRDYRSRRSIDENQIHLPAHIKYKIRMDIDYVPLTDSIKSYFWRPGPRDDFFEEIRYFRGFAQFQQMIDRAIIRVQTEGNVSGLPPTYLQQFPYPCYEKDDLGFFLKALLPVAFVISWIFLVAFFVRQRVLEKEQHLDEILHVMGLGKWTEIAAWFLTSIIIMSGIVGVETLMLSVGGILRHSNIILLFSFYLSYALAVISFCYMLSCIFNTATIAALVAVIAYLLAFLPFVIATVRESVLQTSHKLLMSLSMSTSFCYGCLYISRFEEQGFGMQWETLWSSPVPGDEMNIGYAIGMLLFDAVLYFALGWFFTHIFPVGGVQPKPWYFPLTPEFWFSKRRLRSTNSTQPLGLNETNMEKASNRMGIVINDLRVVYNPRKSNERVAVNGISMELSEGHITTLLGQNGAGKTTTIKVLTGQQHPTSGSVYAYGRSIPEEFDEIRKILGYCPQYNTLFERLTVREHLVFFARLKGLLEDYEIEDDVERMLDDMGLRASADKQARCLSGGLQRRLCVALSFVGGSKLIILDEPTSSVDPVARRNIWDLVLKYKHDRTILLTTHHMDEADLLSDKVAFVHKGNLMCQGSPLMLKSQFGCGYQLMFTRQGDPLKDDDSGHASSNNSDDGTSDTKSLIDLIASVIPNSQLISDHGSQVIASIPQRDSQGNMNDFSTLFSVLDEQMIEYGFSNYGLTSTTLEEVFLTLSSLVDRGQVASSMTDISKPSAMNIPLSKLALLKSLGDPERTSPTDEVLPNKPLWDSSSSESLNTECVESLKWRQFCGLMQKRWLHTTRNWRVLISSFLLPLGFVILAMSFALLQTNTTTARSITLTTATYGPGAVSFVSGPQNETRFLFSPNGIGTTCMLDEQKKICLAKEAISSSVSVFYHYSRGFSSQQCPSVTKAQNILRGVAINATTVMSSDVVYDLGKFEDISDYILATYPDFAEKRYGGWSFDRDQVKIWFENNGYHAMPAYQNAITNARLRHWASQHANARINAQSVGVTVINHPLQLTSEQLGRESLLHRIGDFGITMVFLLGYSFIPAAAAMYLVGERVSEQKQVQHVSGVGHVLYWSSAFAWDALLVLCTAILTSLPTLLFGFPTYTDRYNYPALLVLMILFGWATMPMSYVLSRSFSESSIAFMVLYCVNIFIGAVLSMFFMLFEIIAATVKAHAVAYQISRYVALIFPQYAFMGGLVAMAKNQIRTDVYALFDQDVYEHPFSMELLGPNYLALTCSIVFWFLLNLALELRYRVPSPFSRRRRRISSGEEEDSDVILERRRVQTQNAQDIVSVMDMVVKYGRHRAVNDVTFGIPRGECFGLLGNNGAGKTTLFRILTGQLQSTSGQVMIRDMELSKVFSRSSQLLSYCPQADALDELLTPRQHLTIYAKLRGIPQDAIEMTVRNALSRFHLGMFSDRPCCTLSRGTRRKVCTAIAMLGKPLIILLDEPTTGMDPLTRRMVWKNVLAAIRDGRSVLLTSHSMEECDALCQRISIMVNGRLKCIGAPQYLKNKFGSGYTVAVRISDNTPEDITKAMNFIQDKYPAARLKAHHCTILEYSLPEKEQCLSAIFKHLQSESPASGIVDFTVTQTTLDQVFVNFAQMQSDDCDDDEEENEEEEDDDDQESDTPNRDSGSPLAGMITHPDDPGYLVLVRRPNSPTALPTTSGSRPRDSTVTVSTNGTENEAYQATKF